MAILEQVKNTEEYKIKKFVLRHGPNRVGPFHDGADCR
jgi:hypothetical protein